MVEVGSMLEVLVLVIIAVVLVLAIFRFGLKQKARDEEHLANFFRRRD